MLTRVSITQVWDFICPSNTKNSRWKHTLHSKRKKSDIFSFTCTYAHTVGEGKEDEEDEDGEKSVSILWASCKWMF